MNNTNWKEIEFATIIDQIYKAKAHTKEELELSDYSVKNSIPFVTRTEVNNCVDGFAINNELDGIEEGNAIVIGDTTATISYQNEKFIAGDHIVVIRSSWINEYTALFIITLLHMERYRYSYGRAYVIDSIKKTKIKLPTNEKEDIDWNYIEEYVKKLNCNNIKTNNVASNEIIKVNTWKEFYIKKLFDVSLSLGDLKAELCDNGEIPLVSSGERNNGIVKYINEDGDGIAQIYGGNKITLDMFCHAFYQPIPFYAVSHGRVNILTPKFNMNKYSGIFIATIINKERFKYSYGRAVYSGVAENMKIRLPIKKDGQLDFKYMENYIKSLPYGDKI